MRKKMLIRAKLDDRENKRYYKVKMIYKYLISI